MNTQQNGLKSPQLRIDFNAAKGAIILPCDERLLQRLGQILMQKTYDGQLHDSREICTKLLQNIQRRKRQQP